MTYWWARGDLNPEPPPCKGGVLTGLNDRPATMFRFCLLTISSINVIGTRTGGSMVACICVGCMLIPCVGFIACERQVL